MDTTTIAETAAAAAHIDASLIISIVALVASILSPLITAVAQGHFRLQEKQMEIDDAKQRRDQQYYTEHRTEIIENYIHTGMRAAAIGAADDIAAFEVASGEIYFYLPKDYWDLLDIIDECAEGGSYDSVRIPMIMLCKRLIENNDIPRQPISNTPKAPGK